jgi:hypothetical protein
MALSKSVVIFAISAFLFFPLASKSGDSVHAKDHRNGHELELSTDIAGLLRKEMLAIQTGMRDLIPAMSAGAWEDVSSIAQNISDSFILKQALTAAQKEELHHVLPQGFIEMDQAFHQSAAMLAHAAELKNPDVMNFYYFKLNTACIACHSKYATQRFPGLLEGGTESNRQH